MTVGPGGSRLTDPHQREGGRGTGQEGGNGLTRTNAADARDSLSSQTTENP